MNSPASRGSGVAVPGRVRARYGSGLVRMFNRLDWLKVGMAWGVAALVVATLTTASENMVFLLSVGFIGFFLLRKANEGSVSIPNRGRQRYGSGLVRLFNRLDWLKVGMTWGIAALVVATLTTAGLARLFEEERNDRAILPDEQQALLKPSMLAHGGDQTTTEIMITHTGQQGPATRTKAAIQAETPEKPPGDGNRIQISRDAVVVQAAAPVRMPEEISIAATPAVGLPPVESVNPPMQVSETTQDTSQVNGPATGQDVVTMATPNRVVSDFGSMDSPAAGDRTGKMVPADDHPVAPPVSRKEKIAALLALGQQSLKQFRLLTPSGDNANHHFREVLVLDPGNPVARDGINQIAERYGLLAKRANKRHDSKLSKVYISRGLQVRPGNRNLLALQDSMRQPPVTTLETMAKATSAVEPPPPQTSFFSRLKALFTWEREEPAPVVERSIVSLNH